MRLFIFLLVGLSCTAQEIDFEGYVQDVSTKEPIPYVNISFLNTLVGTSTDEDGAFSITIPKELLSTKVHISSLGYQDTVLLGKTVYQNKKVELTEATMKLDEVILSGNFGDSKTYNPVSSYAIKSGFDASSTPWILALYFPNIGAAKKYLESVTVFFRERQEFTRDRAKFRLRFFSVDPVTKTPKEDLLRKSILLEAVKGREYTTINISDLKLKMPTEGVFVGLEWLFIPYNWYKKDERDNLTNKPRIEDRFAPTFGGVYSKNSNFKLYVYGMGEWRPFTVQSKGNNQSLIPALSLKVNQKLKK